MDDVASGRGKKVPSNNKKNTKGITTPSVSFFMMLVIIVHFRMEGFLFYDAGCRRTFWVGGSILIMSLWHSTIHSVIT
jgi:hypothetical protein